MNDYMKLVAHAASKFTGRPAVLSPLLDSYCGWENKKNRFSSEPTKVDFRIILSTGGLSFEELEIDLSLKLKPKEPSPQQTDSKTKLDPTPPPKEADSKTKLDLTPPPKEADSKTKLDSVSPSKQADSEKIPLPEYEGHLKIKMKHGSKKLGENNFNWSRDCTYEYKINFSLAPLAYNLAAYWTDDDFLVIQARALENPFLLESGVKADDKTPKELLNFSLIPTEVIDVLEPALNVPFLKQILKAVKKKSNEVCSYVNVATEVPEANDVLSLLKCIPLTDGKKMDLDIEKLKFSLADQAAAVQSSQEESVAESSRTEPEDSVPPKQPKSTSSLKSKSGKKT